MADWLRYAAAVLVIMSSIVGMGIAGQRADEAKEAFNRYQRWFASLDATDQEIDMTVGGIRYRGYGSEAKKQEAWDRDWRSKHPEWGPVSAGTTVSSEIPEIWFDVRQSKSGALILPPHVIGHEPIHVLRLKDGRVIDPDTLINKDIY